MIVVYFGDVPKRENQKGNKVDYLLDAQNRLTTALGRRVTIKQSKGKGKIELEYYTQDDFDVLFDALSTIEAGRAGGNR